MQWLKKGGQLWQAGDGTAWFYVQECGDGRFEVQHVHNQNGAVVGDFATRGEALALLDRIGRHLGALDLDLPTPD